MRIIPPPGVSVDAKRRPYVIIDPRAGHGPGIGGFKDDSQVGVALRDGHPVYFVIFFPEPEPGQTLLDVCEAEREFVRKVRELHPQSRKPVIIGIRPEDLEDASLASDTAQGARLKGEVELTEALGAEVMVHFRVDARPAVTEETRELAQDRGDAAESATDGGGATIVGRFGARTRLRKGDTAEVAVDTRNLHFFDPETGLGIYDGKESVG